MKSILDPTFRYVDSSHTDLRSTFERIRREREATAQTAPTDQPTDPKVVRLVTRKEQA